MIHQPAMASMKQQVPSYAGCSRYFITIVIVRAGACHILAGRVHSRSRLRHAALAATMSIPASEMPERHIGNHKAAMIRHAEVQNQQRASGLTDPQAQHLGHDEDATVPHSSIPGSG